MALLALLGAGGCCSKPGPHEQPRSEAARVAEKYGGYFGILSSEERALFDALESDESRDLFLAERGADVKLQLQTDLKRGMGTAAVRELLGRPLDEERTWEGGQLLEYWTYRRPNPVGETLFTVRFAAGKLAGWEVKTTAGY